MRANRDATDALIRRARGLAVVEAGGWTIVAGILSRSILVAAAVGACLAAWRWRRSGAAAIVHAIERIDPLSQNVFVTAHELLAGMLTTSEPVRVRVLADAAAVVRRADRAAVVSSGAALRAVAVAAVALAIAAMPPLWRARVTELPSSAGARVVGRSLATVQPLRVRAAIRPLAYTGLKEIALVHRGRGGRGAADDSGRRIADALPSVRITAPSRDLVYSRADARIEFAAQAVDDFGLRSVRLRYTKVSGSGDNFAFENGEIPLTVARTTSREWSGRAARTLADLHLQDGDTLVYRGVATDARDEDGTGSSDAFFIELSKLGAAAGDAFTLPEEETRYALSQRMLIVKRNGCSSGAKRWPTQT